MEFAVRDLAEGLVSRHGYEVTVLTTNAYSNANFRDGQLESIPIDPSEVQNGVRVRRFPVVTRWAPWLRVAQGVAWRARLPGNDRLRTLYQGPISPGLRSALASEPADVVLAGSFPLNHLKYAFGRRDGAPVVLLGSVHPWDAWGYERPNLLRLTGRAAATVAHTESERRWFVERGAPQGKVHVIPEGIDVPPTPPPGRFRAENGIPPQAFLIAYVGQQGSHKGIDTLIRALPSLLRNVPDAWLVVAGAPTPYSESLRRLATSLPPSGLARLILAGQVDEATKSAILADCDVFASPSRHESFGITVLEAWAHSRPVIVGEGPAQRELLDGGRLGRLVPYGDEDSLLRAIAELAADPAARAHLGEAGHRQLLERYTITHVVSQYDALLEDVRARPR